MRFLLSQIIVIMAAFTFSFSSVIAMEQVEKYNDTVEPLLLSAQQSQETQKNSSKSPPVKKGKLEYSDILNLCRYITGDNKPDALIDYFNRLIKKLGITKEEFNTKTIHTVYCAGSYFIEMAAKWFLNAFMAIVNFGVDLTIPLVDYEGKVSTFKDYIAYQYKKANNNLKPHYGRIYKYLRDNNIKGCKERPELKCTKVY